ncbi:diaminobutyrate--2-oxoglutarate transaminase [Kitasatospora sp. NPDC092039]|uniref:diaminobutyrate--2-oxoglutarate transaminase n=1 Tax=Kitasatospora sp. NPDC092039 TaxID=3364086 RepID=UPI00381F9D2A
MTVERTAPATPGEPPAPGDHALFETMEADVRLYCRKFPVVFERAKGAELHAEDGRVFLDFFCGAGALNYGHNPDPIKRKLAAYLAADGVSHGLDMYTVAKRDFLARMDEVLLRPRGLDHKVQFTGPTGTDAVEAALKLARKATGRRGLVAFTGGFHGMSQGSLAVTGSRRARRAGGAIAQDVTFVPYEDGPHGAFDSIGYLERLLTDPSSGTDLPAAVIVEPLQMEGGVYPASADWLRRLRDLTDRHGILLIADEIQSGCGRTGTFFAFEQSGIVPDLITLSKSIGGYGLPLSLVLLRRDLDCWEPGEHTGTFRGNQLAFVAATAAWDYWEQPEFLDALADNAERLREFGETVLAKVPGVTARGRGMVLGLDLAGAGGPERAERVQRYCFDHGLVVELAGRHDEVVKLLPPLAIDRAPLERGLAVVLDAILAG